MTESGEIVDERQTVTISIDGDSMEVEKGTTILSAATSAGISIPTLCHYGGIDPIGACRICVVELKDSRGGRLVPSCHYAVDEPIEVETRSERHDVRTLKYSRIWQPNTV